MCFFLIKCLDLFSCFDPLQVQYRLQAIKCVFKNILDAFFFFFRLNMLADLGHVVVFAPLDREQQLGQRLRKIVFAVAT